MLKDSVIDKQKPPFDEKRQTEPGIEAEMRNEPDYGEDSYKGSGRLAGK